MNIMIYGGGAVGLGIASCLLQSGARIDIIGRESTVSSLHREGLVREGIFGHYRFGPDMFGSFVMLEDIPPRIYDYILVCTKSFDSETAAKDISGHPCLLDQGTKIVLFQNGWGNAEIFIRFLPKSQVYNARVITGFSRPRPNEVVITVHADAIHIGSLFRKEVSHLNDLCVLIAQGGIPCELTDYIERDVWAKMLYNCALNPLGAILNVPYGMLGAYEYTRMVMAGIVQEIFLVMKRGGYTTHWENPEDYLKNFYERMLPPTAQHESSTLQDIRSKKKTEIDALNGAIVTLADRFAIEVPFNRLVYNLIKFMEIRNLTD
ncbi:MAG: ketopantoate reductase family protein [bacterium]